MKIGMRTVKTAIAVSLSVLVSQILKLKSPFYAGIAAIITMKGTVFDSFKMGKNRMLGTVLGAFIGLICSLISPGNPLIIGIGIIIIIYLCNILGWKNSITIGGIVFLSIILNQETGERISYSLHRTLDTFVGIIIGVLINSFILPPNIEKKIQISLYRILDESTNLIKQLTFEKKQIKLDIMKKNLNLLDENYKSLKKEIELNFSKTKEASQFQEILLVFKNLYVNLNILSNIKGNRILNINNKKNIEKIYKNKLPDNPIIETEDLDVVFNYHLEQCLDELTLINKMINNLYKK